MALKPVGRPRGISSIAAKIVNERRKAIKEFVDAEQSYSRREIADALGVSVGTIDTDLRAMRANGDIQ